VGTGPLSLALLNRSPPLAGLADRRTIDLALQGSAAVETLDAVATVGEIGARDRQSFAMASGMAALLQALQIARVIVRHIVVPVVDFEAR
jgi:hypothetical protein